MRENYEMNWRKEKRMLRKLGMHCPIEMAFIHGGMDAYLGRPLRPSYPPGRRHDAYVSGYDTELWDKEISYNDYPPGG